MPCDSDRCHNYWRGGTVWGMVGGMVARGIIRGIIAFITTSVLTGLCLVYGIIPGEVVAWVISEPPLWLSHPLSRIAAFLLGGFFGFLGWRSWTLIWGPSEKAEPASTTDEAERRIAGAEDAVTTISTPHRSSNPRYSDYWLEELQLSAKEARETACGDWPLPSGRNAIEQAHSRFERASEIFADNEKVSRHIKDSLRALSVLSICYSGARGEIQNLSENDKRDYYKFKSIAETNLTEIERSTDVLGVE